MTALPLVARELQAEAHRSFTYWSRVVAGGLVVATFAVGSLQLPVGPSQYGPFLFRSLNTAVSFAIYLLVPVLTADCISREKREGTLGLLFLTPLRPGDILVGKALIHGLRALTILFAALPLLGLPLMLGGVRWEWAVYASMSHLSSLLLAVAAGLIASVRNSEWIRALITAELLSGLFALIFSGLGYFVWGQIALRNLLGTVAVLFLFRFLQKSRLRNSNQPDHSQYSPDAPGIGQWQDWAAGLHLREIVARPLALFWPLLMGGFGYLTWHMLGLGKLLMAAGFFLWLLQALAVQLKQSWQKDLTSPPQPDWVKIFSQSDFWRSLFRWNKSRTLDRNPIAWLQEYSWTARLTKWGWCLLLIAGEFTALLSERHFVLFQSRLNLLVALGLVFSASGSFRRERETGALELLLVTPLQARHLVGGRLWGIWCHFLPAMAVLYSCWLMMPFASTEQSWFWVVFGISTFLFLPVIGMYFSIQPMNYLMACLATAGFGLLLPWLASLGQVFLLTTSAPNPNYSALVACGLQALIAAFAARQLYQLLSRREFVFQPGAIT